MTATAAPSLCCEHCGAGFHPARRGRPPRFCSRSCQVRAYRRRAARSGPRPPARNSRIARVIALHQPGHDTQGMPAHWCDHCERDWPCPTWTILTGNDGTDT